jgi:RsiW-degrading membrane proteinase PrsW (M82 family)
MDGIKIFLAILPVFIFALYVYIHDNEKEPTNMLIKAFVFGMLIAIPCIYVESALSSAFYFLQKSYITSLLYVFLVIALVEEGYKFLATYILFYHDKNVNYTFDMIVYTTFLGLGFAFFENIIYLRSLPIASVILRGFTAVPVHLSCGIIMGYYSSLMKTDKKNVIIS